MSQICPLCNGDVENISTHVYPCKCGEDIEVLEYVCFTCGCSFEVVDDEIIGDPIDNIRETMNIMSELNTDPEEFLDFISNLEREMMGRGTETMLSLTHLCLKCGSPSFDDGLGVISCSKCGFEWEVISH